MSVKLINTGYLKIVLKFLGKVEFTVFIRLAKLCLKINSSLNFVHFTLLKNY